MVRFQGEALRVLLLRAARTAQWTPLPEARAPFPINRLKREPSGRRVSTFSSTKVLPL